MRPNLNTSKTKSSPAQNGCYKNSSNAICKPSISWNDKHKNSNKDLYKASLVVTTEEFIQLRESWNDLLNQSTESYPFLSWEWLFSWWEIFAQKGEQLLIILVHQGSELVGIAPFYIKKKAIGRALKSIGEGEKRDEAIITHYQDIICKNKKNEFVTAVISEYLNENKTWDYTEFSFVLDNSNLMTLMQKSKPVYKMTSSLGFRYLLDLKRSFDELYASLGKSSRKSFRSKRNRLQKKGELTLSSLDVEKDIDDSLDIHASFHTHRQQELGHEAQYLKKRFRQFHASLLKRLKGTGKAEIRTLNVDDNPIASSLNYISNNDEKATVYSYSGGYKITDDSRLSPMFIFDMLEFEYLIENNVAYYDFLSATEEASYKNTYRCDTYAVSKIRWFEDTKTGFIYYKSFKLRHSLSFVKKKINQWMLV